MELYACRVPSVLKFESWPLSQPNCGDDHVVAVNLARPMTGSTGSAVYDDDDDDDDDDDEEEDDDDNDEGRHVTHCTLSS